MSNPGPAVTTAPSNLHASQIIAASIALALQPNQPPVNVIQAAAGAAIVLPPALGTGLTYRLQVGTTVTSNSVTIQTATTGAGSDAIQGNVVATGATGATTSWKSVVTAGSQSNTVTLNGSTLGGIVGDVLEFTDILAGVWSLQANTSITGTAATPLSHV